MSGLPMNSCTATMMNNVPAIAPTLRIQVATMLDTLNRYKEAAQRLTPATNVGAGHECASQTQNRADNEAARGKNSRCLMIHWEST
jgi:hypothetical protein